MKKVLSLLMVCLLVLSISVAVSAGSYGTISIEKIESTVDISSTIDDLNPNGYYTVKVNVTDLYAYDEIDNFVGYNSLEIHVNYDPAVFTAGYKSLNSRGKEIVTYSSDKVLLPTLDSNGDVTSAMAIKSSNPTAGDITIVASAGLNDQVIEGTDLGDGVFCEIYLAPVDEATGKSEISVGKVAFGGSGGIGHIDVQTKVPGYIDLGSAPVPPTPEVPETSTVRTFPKLKWDEATGSLTTVGVITVGKDYDTLKYGINIEKAENTVNYWANSAVKTVDEAEAYYAVRLDGITEETDIKVTSASKAVLSNGAQGDAVTYVAE